MSAWTTDPVRSRSMLWRPGDRRALAGRIGPGDAVFDPASSPQRQAAIFFPAGDAGSSRSNKFAACRPPLDAAAEGAGRPSRGS